MKPITITEKSIEKIGKIFEKTTGDAFFYAMRQHKYIWPKLVKCSYEKAEDGTETVKMASNYSLATIRAYGKDLLVTISSDEPVINGQDEIKYTLRKPKDSAKLCSHLNGISLLLKHYLDWASTAVQSVSERIKLYLNVNLPQVIFDEEDEDDNDCTNVH